MNKILNFKNNNPRYWDILISRSQYDESEISETLDQIQSVNDKLDELKNKSYALLEDENGLMDHFNGYATDDHKLLNQLLYEADSLYPNMSENSHKNPLPVRKWQSEIKKLNRQMKKIEKVITQVTK